MPGDEPRTGDRSPGARPAARRATSTPTSRPTATSRSTSTPRRRVERGIAELAITDHVDFEPGDAGLRLRHVRRARADRPRGRRALGAAAASRSGSGSSSPTTARWEADIRDHLARHAYDFVIGSRPRLAPTRRTTPRASRRWVAGRPLAEIVAPVLRRGRGGGPVRPVRHDRPPRLRQALPRPARARRPTSRPRPELYEPILRRPRRERHGARGQHQRPAPPGRRDVPARGRSWRASGSSAAAQSPPAPTPTATEHFALGPRGGGMRVAAPRPASTSSTFRRGGDRVAVELLAGSRVRVDRRDGT